MTESNQVADFDVQNSGVSSVSAAESVPAPAEKVFTQDEVNHLIGKAKNEVKAKYANNQQSQPSNTQMPSNFGGIAQVSKDDLASLIDQRLSNFSQEAEKKALEAEANRQTHQITQTLAQKCLNVPDFEQRMQGFEYNAIVPLMSSLANKDNPGEMLLELKANPQKIVTILALAHTMPGMAEQQLQELSDSIRQNQNAVKAPSAREPLSQIKPSITGTDNGSRTVSDLRKHPRFKV